MLMVVGECVSSRLGLGIARGPVPRAALIPLPVFSHRLWSWHSRKIGSDKKPKQRFAWIKT
eukprot:5114718-Pyramimonas_sp.AAC.3